MGFRAAWTDDDLAALINESLRAERKTDRNGKPRANTDGEARFALDGKYFRSWQEVLAQFKKDLEGVELTPEQQDIYNAVITPKATARIRINDLNELEDVFLHHGSRKKGAQKLILVHYEGKRNPVTALEVVNMGDVIRRGKLIEEGTPEHPTSRRYELTAEDGATLKVVIDYWFARDKNRSVINFYSDRKPGAHNVSSRRITDLDNNIPPSNEMSSGKAEKTTGTGSGRLFSLAPVWTDDDLAALINESLRAEKRQHPGSENADGGARFALPDDKTHFKIVLNDLGKYSDAPITVVGRAPFVLQRVGMKRNSRITITTDVIRKAEGQAAASDGSFHTPITIAELEKLPDSLYNPIMIFRSETHPDNSVVLLTELKDSVGKSVVVAIRLNVEESHGIISSIRSAYGKDNESEVLRWIADKNLLYIHKKKALYWAQSRGLQLPKEAFPTTDTAAQGYHNIVDESDNVKFFSVAPEDSARLDALTDSAFEETNAGPTKASVTNVVRKSLLSSGFDGKSEKNLLFSVASEDSARLDAMTKALLPFVNTTYINTDAAAAYLADHGIAIDPARDEEILRTACVNAREAKRERNHKIRRNDENRAGNFFSAAPERC